MMGRPRLYTDILNTIEGQQIRWSSIDFSRLGIPQTSGGLWASPKQIDVGVGIQTTPTTWGYITFQETDAILGSPAYLTQFPLTLLEATARPIWIDRFELFDNTDIRLFSGFSASNDSVPVDSDAPPVVHFGVQYSTDRGDTTLMVSSFDTAQILTPTTAPPPAPGEVYQVQIFAYPTAAWRVEIFNVGTGKLLWAGNISAQVPTSAFSFFTGISTRTGLDSRSIGRHGTKIGLPGALFDAA